MYTIMCGSETFNIGKISALCLWSDVFTLWVDNLLIWDGSCILARVGGHQTRKIRNYFCMSINSGYLFSVLGLIRIMVSRWVARPNCVFLQEGGE